MYLNIENVYKLCDVVHIFKKGKYYENLYFVIVFYL